MELLVKKWLKIWIPVLVTMGAGFVTYIIMNWNITDIGTKFVALFYIILPLHVVEEWRLPGGFHYNYNVTMKSDRVDRYPMNQVTDMLTNFIAEIIGIVLLFVGVNKIIVVWHIIFCCLEMFMHSMFGCKMYLRFKQKGKKTWYNPGYITAILFFATAVPISISYIPSNPPSVKEWFFGIVVFLVEMAVIILIPENTFKSKDTPYPFEGKYQYGYYQKFIE